MKTTLSTILQIGLFLLFGTVAILMLVNSCNEDKSDLEEIKELFEKNKTDIEKMNKDIQDILIYAETSNKYFDSLYSANSKTIKRFNYEISQMDEMFKNSSDTLLVNSVLRYWADRLYTKLPGFFQTAVIDTGVTTNR